MIGVWSIIGYNMVLFLGGLQEIPGDYYEAAKIDGASGIRQFFSITMPLLSPTTFFIVQTRIIGALTIYFFWKFACGEGLDAWQAAFFGPVQSAGA